jgi:hypothetical protein
VRRLVILLSCLAAGLVFVHYLVRQPSLPDTHVASFAASHLRWLAAQAPWIERTLLTLVALAGCCGALLASVICVRLRGAHPGLTLATALASLAVATAVWCFVLVLPPYVAALARAPAVAFAGEPAAAALAMFGLATLIRFFARYPVEVTAAQFARAFEPTDALAAPRTLAERFFAWRGPWDRLQRKRLEQAPWHLDRDRRLLSAWFRIVVSPRFAIALALIACFVWAAAAAGWAGGGFAAFGRVLVRLGLLLALLLWIEGLIFVVMAAFQNASDVDRRRIEWIAFVPTATALALLALLYPLLIGHWLFATRGSLNWAHVATLFSAPIMALVVLGALAMSMFYRGAIDPALMLRRSALYSLLGVVLTTLFVAVEGAMSNELVARLGLPQQLGSIAAGTAVALAFAPVRARIDAAIKRRFGEGAASAPSDPARAPPSG